MTEHYKYENGKFVEDKSAMRNAIGFMPLKGSDVLVATAIVGLSAFLIYKMSKGKFEISWE